VSEIRPSFVASRKVSMEGGNHFKIPRAEMRMAEVCCFVEPCTYVQKMMRKSLEPILQGLKTHLVGKV
jgi:hypothetical protein